jgi:predicted DCC family thiol-disulfide oxidoreductase YuxK
MKQSSITDILLHKQPLMMYDGECALCNHLIQFYLKREKAQDLNFVSLDSPTAHLLTQHFELKSTLDSMVLIRGYNAYIKSCAALRLCGYMKGLWPLMQVFLIIPPFLRNWVYDFVAKRRIKWFGLQQACMNISGFRKERFIN